MYVKFGTLFHQLCINFSARVQLFREVETYSDRHIMSWMKFGSVISTTD